MEALIFLLAEALPMETVIEQIEKYLASYKEQPTKKNKNMLAMACVLFATKVKMENKGEGFADAYKDFQRMEAADKLLNPEKQ